MITLNNFFQGLAKVASVSLSIGYPTIVSVPHSVVNGFKRLLAIAAATDITFKEAEQLKEFLAVSSEAFFFLPLFVYGMNVHFHFLYRFFHTKILCG